MIKNQKNVQIEIAGRTFFCPVEVTMSIMGGKWTAPILWYLKGKTLRFNELRKLLVTISEKVMIKELKTLEKVGLIERKSYAEVPPRVEYSISAYGKTIIPIVDLISKWGDAHSKKFGKIVEG
ncbi:MAG: helix-turn-helix domain-containing protein [Chryseolinea sp.]